MCPDNFDGHVRGGVRRLRYSIFNLDLESLTFGKMYNVEEVRDLFCPICMHQLLLLCLSALRSQHCNI